MNKKMCREWFLKFKEVYFNVKDKDRSGRPKIYEDVELEELFAERIICGRFIIITKGTCSNIGNPSASSLTSCKMIRNHAETIFEINGENFLYF